MNQGKCGGGGRTKSKSKSLDAIFANNKNDLAKWLGCFRIPAKAPGRHYLPYVWMMLCGDKKKGNLQDCSCCGISTWPLMNSIKNRFVELDKLGTDAGGECVILGG